MKHIVYKIEATGGFTYIGITTDLAKRLAEHRYNVAKGRLGIYKLDTCAKFKFDHKVLAECDDLQSARKLEIEFIKADQTANELNCNKNL